MGLSSKANCFAAPSAFGGGAPVWLRWTGWTSWTGWPSWTGRLLVGLGMLVWIYGSLQAAGAADSTHIVTEESDTAEAVLVGVVLPSDTQPGDTVSGSIVTDVHKYKETPGLRVVEVKVPKTTVTGTTRDDYQIQVGESTPQPVTETFTTKVSESGTTVPVRITSKSDHRSIAQCEVPLIQESQAGQETRGRITKQTVREKTVNAEVKTAEQRITEETQSSTATNDSASYTTPALYIDTGVQVIRGALSGDGSQTHITVDQQPGQVIAESPRAVYWRLPKTTRPGSHEVNLQDGPVRVKFPVSSLHLGLSADRLTLMKGEATTFRATLSGPETLPAEAWEHGEQDSELVDVAKVAKESPKIHLPGAGDKGSVLLRIENQSRGTVALTRGDVVALQLNKKDFEHGPYVYQGGIQSRQSGGFKINAVAVSFCKSVAGQPIDSVATPQGTQTFWEQIQVTGSGAKRLPATIKQPPIQP